jgi:hypothetical protein
VPITRAGRDALVDQIIRMREMRRAGDKQVQHSIDAALKQLELYDRELARLEGAQTTRPFVSYAAVSRD